MKVKELIEILSKLNQDAEVYVEDHYHQDSNPLFESDIRFWEESVEVHIG